MKRRGVAAANNIGPPVFHVPKGTIYERIERNCRGSHRWRVVSFSYQKRKIQEKCSACGETLERAFERREA